MAVLVFKTSGRGDELRRWVRPPRALVKNISIFPCMIYSYYWGRMFPNGIEQPTQMNHSIPIKEKCRDCRTTSRSKPDDQREVVAPGEVGIPAIVTGMVQWHALAAHWIERFNLVILVVIATLTRKREVFQRCRSALGTWSHVLDRKGLRSIASLTATILAASIRAFGDVLAEFRTNTLLRHGLRAEYQARPSRWGQLSAGVGRARSVQLTAVRPAARSRR